MVVISVPGVVMAGHALRPEPPTEEPARQAGPETANSLSGCRPAPTRRIPALPSPTLLQDSTGNTTQPGGPSPEYSRAATRTTARALFNTNELQPCFKTLLCKEDPSRDDSHDKQSCDEEQDPDCDRNAHLVGPVWGRGFGLCLRIAHHLTEIDPHLG